MNKCPICGIKECEIKMNPGPEDFYLVSCKRCGKYSLSDIAALSNLSEFGDRHLLSGAVRNRFENDEELYFSLGDFKNLLDTVRIPSNPDESINLLLKHISGKLKNPADSVKFTPLYDFPLLFVEGPGEFEYFLNQAQKLNYVEFDDTYKGYRLTLEGMRQVEELRRKELADSKKSILVFISYSTKDKDIVGKIKEQLEEFGLKVFVGHDDINPSSEWVKEILRNLGNCDIFIPYLTKDFKKSKWTNQECGIAESLKKCTLPLKLKYNPYGFISKYQALDISNKNTHDYGFEIIKKIVKKNKFPKLRSVIIESFINSRSFEVTRDVFKILFLFEKLSKKEITRIAEASLTNDQIYKYVSTRRLLKDLVKKSEGITPSLYKKLNSRFGWEGK